MKLVRERRKFNYLLAILLLIIVILQMKLINNYVDIYNQLLFY
jgi:hypothetical protein